MKLFIGSIPTDEEVHKLRHGIDDILSKLEPDYIILVVGEDAAIHNVAVAELHMFEYKNVIYSAWGVYEDIIYRLENSFDYRVVVYPVTGEYRCPETGFTGRFKGRVSLDQFLYMELVKPLSDLVEEEVEATLYLSDTYASGVLERVVRDLFAVENRIRGGWRLTIHGDGEPQRSTWTVDWRAINPYEDIGIEAVAKLRMGGLAYNQGLYKTMMDLLENGRIVDDALKTINSVYLVGTNSDREEYILMVDHLADLPIMTGELAKMLLATRILRFSGTLIDDVESPVYRLAESCGSGLENLLRELVS